MLRNILPCHFKLRKSSSTTLIMLVSTLIFQTTDSYHMNKEKVSKVVRSTMAGILTTIRCGVQALLFAFAMTCGLAIGNILLKLVRMLPEQLIPKQLPEKFRKQNFDFGVSYKSFLMVLRFKYLHFSCPTAVGRKAPNINILTLDNVKKKLLDFEKAGRPLVVNFGSCS